MMRVLYVRSAPTAHPTGDPSFAVKQCMPGAIPEAEIEVEYGWLTLSTWPDLCYSLPSSTCVKYQPAVRKLENQKLQKPEKKEVEKDESSLQPVSQGFNVDLSGRGDIVIPVSLISSEDEKAEGWSSAEAEEADGGGQDGKLQQEVAGLRGEPGTEHCASQEYPSTQVVPKGEEEVESKLEQQRLEMQLASVLEAHTEKVARESLVRAVGGWRIAAALSKLQKIGLTPQISDEKEEAGAKNEDESDPFLMCDEFGPTTSTHCGGVDSDEGFDVDWHPHHGMEILSYMVEGRGRHADSLGNREIFDSPGFQWLSVGSGIEHAEGGGTPLGQINHGFQIWLRMPTENMEDDPRYGIVNPVDIPTVRLEKGLVRVIAGSLDEIVGPAKYAVTVQILDVELEADAEWNYTCPDNMDNVIFYAFKGGATLNGKKTIKAQQTCRFDTSGPRTAHIQSGPDGYRGLVFTGKMTKEKIIWKGPFVCSSKENLMNVFRQYQVGGFPPKRVRWDYRDIRQKPSETTI